MAATKRIEAQQLTENQQIAAGLIASGLRGNSTAKRVGISESQLSRWRQLPAFRGEVNRLLNEASAEVKDKLIGLSTTAVDILAVIMIDASISPADRIRAATAILSMVGAGNQSAPIVRLGDRLPETPTQIETADRERDRPNLERDFFDCIQQYNFDPPTPSVANVGGELGRIADLYGVASEKFLNQSEQVNL